LDHSRRKQQEIIEDNIHNEERHHILSRKVRLAGHVTYRGDMKNAYRILMRKPERKGPLRRLGHRWEVVGKTILECISEK